MDAATLQIISAAASFANSARALIQSTSKGTESEQLLQSIEHHQRNLYESFSHRRTLLITSTEQNFWNHFILQTVSFGGKRSVTYEDLPNRVILFGHAGAGKSTYLRYHYCRLVQAGTTPVIFIELHQLSDHNSILEYLNYKLEPTNKIQSFAELRTLLSTDTHFLLDGLDEVPSSSVRRIKGEIEALCEHFPSSRVVITSRPAATLDIPVFDKANLNLFSQKESLQFIDVSPIDSSVKEHLKNHLTRDKEKLEEFGKTPLLLSMMILVFLEANSINFPFVAFYDRCIQALLSDHDNFKGSFKRLAQSEISRIDLRRIAESVSWQLIDSSKNSVRKREFLELIRRAALELSISVQNVESVYEDLVVSHSIFIEDGHFVRGIHLAITEYLAASYLYLLPQKTRLSIFNSFTADYPSVFKRSVLSLHRTSMRGEIARDVEELILTSANLSEYFQNSGVIIEIDDIRDADEEPYLLLSTVENGEFVEDFFIVLYCYGILKDDDLETILDCWAPFSNLITEHSDELRNSLDVICTWGISVDFSNRYVWKMAPSMGLESKTCESFSHGLQQLFRLSEFEVLKSRIEDFRARSS